MASSDRDFMLGLALSRSMSRTAALMDSCLAVRRPVRAVLLCPALSVSVRLRLRSGFCPDSRLDPISNCCKGKFLWQEFWNRWARHKARASWTLPRRLDALSASNPDLIRISAKHRQTPVGKEDQVTIGFAVVSPPHIICSLIIRGLHRCAISAASAEERRTRLRWCRSGTPCSCWLWPCRALRRKRGLSRVQINGYVLSSHQH